MSKEATHTSGPWEVDEAHSGKGGKLILAEVFVRRPGDDVSIAADIVDPETGEPSHANARLISAAPDLLFVLSALVEFMGDTTPEDAELDVWVQARAAISKAQGGAR